MHELSIALSMIDLGAEEARRRGARVLAMHLKLGPLSGVVKEALQSAYELAREGTPLADSRLVIEETPLLTNCTQCKVERSVASIQDLRCVVCGTSAMEITSGREMEIFALEIEE